VFKTGVVTAIACFLAISSLAFAAQSGDMFDNAGTGPNGRPSVPSDRYVGPDLLRSVPVFIEPNADMFGRLRVPYDFGRPDMVGLPPQPVPYYPLYEYPKKR
jgi:hypothetical protein